MGDSFAERSQRIKEDNCKRLLLLPKLILQTICMWPEIKSPIISFFGMLLFLNTFLLFLLNLNYMVNVVGNMANTVEAFTTLNVTAQSLLRMYTLMIYKKEFEAVIKIVWDDFIPLKTLTESQRKSIDIRTKRYLILLVSFVVGGYLSCIFYMFGPILITNERIEPVLIKFPFSVNVSETPYYEITQIWVFLISQAGIMMPFDGFDTFYGSMVYNCSVQFKILRYNLTNMFDERDSSTDSEDVRVRREKQIELLIKNIQHHKLLIDFCDVLKYRFRYMLLIQLMQNAFAICFCAFAGVTVPVLMPKMVVFSTTYILQLFLFCTFGNELTHQSRKVASAAFNCGWHFTDNPKLTKLLIPLIQNSQKGEELSARGFTAVNYASFITVLRLAFSCYTVLKNMVAKNQEQN